jgi:DNA-binding transcriptional regulator YiaG
MRHIDEVVLAEYEDDQFGYPVVLCDSAIKRTYPGGEEAIEIPDSENLIAAIAIARALCPLQLIPAEIRFLRKAMKMTGKDLADAMQTTGETVSRWVKDQPMGGFAEKLLRELVFAELKEKAPGIPIPDHAVARMKLIRREENDQTMPRFVFKRLPMIFRGNGTQRLETWDLEKAA